jgi:DnaJ-class molecular chaperone
LDDRYWHFLGLKPSASAAEISAARNRLARMFHPDRGGTVEDMQRLNEAVEIVTGKREAPSSSIFGKGSSSSSSPLADLARILHLEAHIQHLGNLWRRLVLPNKIENWSLT